MTATVARERKHWGWGFADEQPAVDELRAAAAGIADVFGFGSRDVEAPVPLERAALPEPRIEARAAGVEVDVSPHARASHAWGKSYSDVVRGFRGRFDHAPDAVLRPADAAGVEAALTWAADADVAVIPYGGGTSVVGGVTPQVDGAAVSLDLGRLDRVLEVDAVSGAARIQAGALGPALEAQLADHGLTLRHFPQSFEFSTLGGWLATRAGGHYATGPTRIDDLAHAITMITPRGTLETHRHPGSGAGPEPARLVLGSEGTLGVITEAWMRVVPRPRWRATASVAYRDFAAGVAAARALAQSGLQPSNARLLDATEARLHRVRFDGTSVLLVGFESADHPLGPWLARALELARDHGGEVVSGPTETEAGAGARSGEAGAWRQAFFDAPYLQPSLLSVGVLSDTFETACTWTQFPELHARVTAAVGRALDEECGGGLVSCRFTHVYPDGPAPYYTFVGALRLGAELAQWRAVKAAASEALAAAGGTITHHHAVGRTHRPWYDRERSPLFAEALRAVKREFDPHGILNPGVLVDA